MPRLRLLTLSHSYVVALNRRLANELARASGGRWEVTAAAPARYRGDLRRIPLERLESEPNALEPVPAHLTRVTHAFFYGPRLVPLLRRGWDLVHNWEEPYILAGAEVAAILPRRVPLVFASFQNLSKRYPPPFSAFERLVVRRASGWIAYGETVADMLSRRPGYAERPSTLIPPGVDTEVFRPDPSAGAEVRRRLGWQAGGPPVVGYLGRFVEEKGLRHLARALERLMARGVEFRALFVGGGPFEPELRALERRLDGRVRIATGVPHDDVPPHLAAMDVLCAPSLTTASWREQFGRMITEAFACGVPVISSDSGELPFTAGEAGVIVPEADEAALERALADLLESPGRRAELGALGRARAEETFAWPVVARRTLSFFDQVLAGNRSG